MRRPFIAANWKMHKTTAEAAEFARKFREIYVPTDVRVAIAAPFTQLAVLKRELEGTGVLISAQNMHWKDSGAFTGEISAAMLREIGVDCCIIGHSERRWYCGETDETVNQKLMRALSDDILPILCVGEGFDERDSGEYMEFVEAQLKKDFRGIPAEYASGVTVAYEPIWAIGTGRSATPAEAQEMCGFIRDVLADIYGENAACEITIQYGGSVKPDNISEIMNQTDVDGALVGGASLDPESFLDIIRF